MKKNEVPIARLHELFAVDPARGELIRRRTVNNRARAGTKAGYRRPDGYVSVTVDRVEFYRHRIIFAMMHNRWPDDQIDHTNGVRGDDRIDNLREATQAENRLNRGAQINNTSGYKGVTWNKKAGKWESRIMVNRKNKNLGLFDCKHEAGRAYAEAAKKYHGEFARVE